MKNKLLIGLVIGMFFLFVPLVHAELVSPPLDDQAPFWHSLLSKIGLFSVTGYDSSNPDDVYCRATYECVKDSSTGKYRYDCYNSGLSKTSCLCEQTTDTSRCAVNQPTSSTTSTTTPTSSYSGGTSTIISNYINGLAPVSSTSTSGQLTSCSPSGQQRCSGSVAQICSGGVWTTSVDCGAVSLSCLSTGTYTSCVNWKDPSQPIGQACDSNTLCQVPGQVCDTKINTCVDTVTNPTIWLNNLATTAATSTSTTPTSSPTSSTTPTITSGSRDITDVEIKGLNSQSYTPTDGKSILHSTSCGSNSDCNNKVCKTLSGAGLSALTMLHYPTFPGINQVCYSGIANTTTPTPLPPVNSTNATATKSASYIIADWLDTTSAGRLQTLCKTADDCAPYTDLTGAGKDYTVQCSAAGQVQSKLQTDVDNVCKSTGTDKYIAIGGAALGFAGGCAALTVTASPLVIATAGVAGLPACVIGGVVGTITSFTAVEGIHNVLQVNCKERTVPSDVGACIAIPKGGYSIVDQVSAPYTLFGISLPVIVWFISFFALIIIIVSIAKPSK